MIASQSVSRKNSVILNQSASNSRVSVCQYSSQEFLRSSSRKSLTSSLCSMKKSTFGNAPRHSPFQSNNQAPAPKYNIKSGIQINLYQRKGSSFSCGRKEIQNSNLSYSKTNYNPGPGSYNATKPKSKKKIVIGLKNRKNCQQKFLNENAIQNYPGPGKYKQQVQRNKGGKFITQSNRFQTDKQNYPGPGRYNKLCDSKLVSSVTLSSPKCAFSKSIRKTYFDERVTDAPGPGKYNLKCN